MNSIRDASSMSKEEWAECMAQVQQRDKRAFALLFHFYSPKLKTFAVKHVGNEQVAMEVVQEAMTTVWQKSHLFDSSKSALSTWIYTIVRNLCFDLLRKHKGRVSHLSSEDLWPAEYCPADLIDAYSPEHDRLKQQVIQFLDRLPESQRDVVKAVYLEELPHQEVAERFDIPLGTVKSRLRLAVEKLKHSMQLEQP
ncbi:sigma-70 family RNA polymerase sigma factor [Vibrio sp. HB161653]|uniref:Sigma-70 family RNA polymerase sigma factor n=2 Tax=unclassified Vibrio TaxID=2614977 RepID=A0AB39HGR1_9VIBR|nr:sigma-70 family RNA polymerase sigma factor [Vibrio sp. HB161653]MDP5254894.1 sigma-70 family RNA polymerase sigma factor [Vibrio sp. HB161653]